MGKGCDKMNIKKNLGKGIIFVILLFVISCINGMINSDTILLIISGAVIGFAVSVLFFR